MRVLLIDNYDSFTHNLAQALMGLGAEVLVHRNDEITPEQARRLEPSHIVISPGPGRPEESGVSLALIRNFTGVVPVLGVCLGHQGIGQVAFVPISLVVGPAFAIAAPLDRASRLRRPSTFEKVPDPSEPPPTKAVIKPAGVSC